MASSNEFVKNIEDTMKQTHQEQSQKIQAEYDATVAAAEKKYKSEMEQIRVNSEKEITTIKNSHRNAIQQIENELQRIETSLQGSAYAWDNSFWKNFVPVMDNDVPPFTRLGMFTAKGNYTTIKTPALLPIIGGQNVVIKASGVAERLRQCRA